MKKYDVQKFELLSNEQIADGIFDMRVKMTSLLRLQSADSLPMFMCLQNSAQTYFGL